MKSAESENVMIVTIDGPAGSGKSSVSRSLALRHGWSWLSSGIFYRGLAFMALEKDIKAADEAALVELLEVENWQVVLGEDQTAFIFGAIDVTEQLHGEKVGGLASTISQHPRVRKKLLGYQRACTTGLSGLVAEGRDCGTVVFPHAQLKIYLTASAMSRAQRRAKEEGVAISQTSEAQKARDNSDLSRTVAPLRVADGAHEIDTSTLSLAEVIAKVDELILAVMGKS